MTLLFTFLLVSIGFQVLLFSAAYTTVPFRDFVKIESQLTFKMPNRFIRPNTALFAQSVNLMTLSRFMIEATRANPDHADLESLIQSIQLACKAIRNQLSTAQTPTHLQSYSTENTSLQTSQQTQSRAMYERADLILKDALRFTGKLGIISSEGEQPVLIEEAWNSKYIAVFDPLDGYSNIDAGIVTGTIFGIFKEDDECLNDFDEQVDNTDVTTLNLLLRNLNPTKNLIAAGYCMYSSSTILVMSFGDGKNGKCNKTTVNSLYHLLFKYVYLCS